MDPGAMNWVASSVTSDVVRQALDSDAATVLATLPQSAEGSSIASDGTNVYVATYDTIFAVSAEGGAPFALASGQSGVAALAVDSTDVYWVDQNDGTILRVALAGGTPALVTSGIILPEGLAIDDQYVYFGDEYSATIGRAPKAGGAAVVLTTATSTPVALAVDDVAVYWTDAVGGVWRVAK